MATLTFSVAAMTRSYTIASTDVTRWLDAYKSILGLPPETSNDVVFSGFSDWLFNYANSRVILYEKEVVARNEASKIPPIPLTPV